MDETASVRTFIDPSLYSALAPEAQTKLEKSVLEYVNATVESKQTAVRDDQNDKSLQVENTQLKKRLETLDSRLLECDETEKQLREALERQTNDAGDGQVELQDLRIRFQKLRASKNLVETELEGMQKKLTIARANEQTAIVEKELLANDLECLEKKSNQMLLYQQSLTDASEEALILAKKKIHQLDSKLLTASSDLAQRDEEIMTLKNEVLSKSEEIEKLSQFEDSIQETFGEQLAANNKLLNEYKKQNNDLSDRLVEKSKEHQKITDEILQLRKESENEISSLQSLLDENQEDCKRKIEHIKSLEEELQNASDLLSCQKDNTGGESKSVDAKIQNFANTLAQDGMTITCLFNQYLQAVQERDEFSDENQRLNKSIKCLLNDLEKVQPQFKKIQEDQNELIDGMATAQRKAECYKKDCENLEKRLVEASNSLKETESERDVLRCRVLTLTDQLKHILSNRGDFVNGEERSSNLEHTSTSEISHLSVFRNSSELYDNYLELLEKVAQNEKEQESFKAKLTEEFKLAKEQLQSSELEKSHEQVIYLEQCLEQSKQQIIQLQNCIDIYRDIVKSDDMRALLMDIFSNAKWQSRLREILSSEIDVRQILDGEKSDNNSTDKKAVDMLVKNNEELKVTNFDLKKKLQTQADESLRNEQDLKLQISTFHKRVNELNESIEQLTVKEMAATSECKMYLSDIEMYKNETSRLKGNLKIVEDARDSAIGTVSQLREDLASLRREELLLRSKQNRQDPELALLKANEKRLLSRIEEYEKRHNQQLQKLCLAEETILNTATQEAKTLELRQQLASLSEEYEKVMTKLTDQRLSNEKSNSSLYSQLRLMEKRLDDESEKYRELRKKYLRTQNHLEVLQSYYKEKDEKGGAGGSISVASNDGKMGKSVSSFEKLLQDEKENVRRAEEALKEAKDLWNKTKSDSDEAIKKFSDEVKAKSEEIKELTDKVATLDEKLDKLKSENAQEKEDLISRLSEAEKRCEEAIGESLEKSSKFENLKSDLALAQHAEEVIKKLYDTIQEDFKQVSKERSELSERIAYCQRELEESRFKFDELQQNLENAEKIKQIETNSLTEEMNDLKKLNDALSTQLDEMNKSNSDVAAGSSGDVSDGEVKKVIRDLQKKINLVTNEKKIAQTDAQKLRTSNKLLNERLTIVRNQLSTEEQRHQTAEQRFSSNDAMQQKLKTIESLGEYNANMQAQLLNSREEHNKLSQKLHEANQEVENCKQIIEENKAEIENLRKRLQKQIFERRNLITKTREQQLSQVSGGVLNNMKQLQSQLQQANREKSELSEEKEKLFRKKEEDVALLNAEKEKVNALKLQLQLSKDEKSKCEFEIKELHSANELARKEINSLQDQIEKFASGSLETSSNEISSLREKLEKQEAELVGAQDSLKAATSVTDKLAEQLQEVEEKCNFYKTRKAQAEMQLQDERKYRNEAESNVELMRCRSEALESKLKKLEEVQEASAPVVIHKETLKPSLDLSKEEPSTSAGMVISSDSLIVVKAKNGAKKRAIDSAEVMKSLGIGKPPLASSPDVETTSLVPVEKQDTKQSTKVEVPQEPSQSGIALRTSNKRGMDADNENSGGKEKSQETVDVRPKRSKIVSALDVDKKGPLSPSTTSVSSTSDAPSKTQEGTLTSLFRLRRPVQKQELTIPRHTGEIDRFYSSEASGEEPAAAADLPHDDVQQPQQQGPSTSDVVEAVSVEEEVSNLNADANSDDRPDDPNVASDQSAPNQGQQIDMDELPTNSSEVNSPESVNSANLNAGFQNAEPSSNLSYEVVDEGSDVAAQIVHSPNASADAPDYQMRLDEDNEQYVARNMYGGEVSADADMTYSAANLDEADVEAQSDENDETDNGSSIEEVNSETENSDSMESEEVMSEADDHDDSMSDGTEDDARESVDNESDSSSEIQILPNENEE